MASATALARIPRSAFAARTRPRARAFRRPADRPRRYHGLQGLQAALAVAWDTMMSPSTSAALRSPTWPRTARERCSRSSPRQSAGDRHAHTRHAGHAEGQHQGRGVHASPGNADLPRPWRPAGPKGRPARPPAPYTKDTLSKDSREIRDVESPGDKRVVSDFRRSGAIEVIAGQGDEAVLASKMAKRSTRTASCRRPACRT
jgi:hypothetical protein